MNSGDDESDGGYNDDATQFIPASSLTPPNAASAGATWINAVEPTHAVSAVQIGMLINNNYKVTEVLSAGGMGEVYKGENVYTNDPVAIKVMLDKLVSDQKASAMFMREARTLSQLSDDAIVRYYNFVRDPIIDRFCLIMEFIEGVPLSDYTAKHGPVPLAAAETLLRRIAKGLEKAHKSGVIHRDLSPDNVMLPSGIIAEARLIDFGIAKSTFLQDGVMTGEFAGKFKFVSPEQLGHFGGDIGPSSDIYGLGLLISAAVLGKPLNMGGSITEAVKAREGIPDLAAIPEDLRPLLAHMLEPDPANRPVSMAHVAALLDAPEDIPTQYHEGRTPRPRRDITIAPIMQNVPGLALPPTTLRGGALPQPSKQVAAVLEVLEDNTVGAALKIMVGVFVLLIAGLGYFAYNQGFFGDSATSLTAPVPNDGQASGLTAIQPNSREGFLATFGAGKCAFATRMQAGPRAGSIDAFAASEAAFADLPAAYETRFGARPAVLTRAIDQPQCAALDLARALQGRAVPPAELQVNQLQVLSGETISGTITDPLAGNVWLALVSPTGLVYNLSDRLTAPVNGRRTFAFQLQLSDGAQAAPQLLVAVVTSKPLVNAAQARDGVAADVVLPLILDEIAKSGGQGIASVGHVRLESTPPEMTPEATAQP